MYSTVCLFIAYAAGGVMGWVTGIRRSGTEEKGGGAADDHEVDAASSKRVDGAMGGA